MPLRGCSRSICEVVLQQSLSYRRPQLLTMMRGVRQSRALLRQAVRPGKQCPHHRFPVQPSSPAPPASSADRFSTCRAQNAQSGASLAARCLTSQEWVRLTPQQLCHVSGWSELVGRSASISYLYQTAKPLKISPRQMAVDSGGPPAVNALSAFLRGAPARACAVGTVTCAERSLTARSRCVPSFAAH